MVVYVITLFLLVSWPNQSIMVDHVLVRWYHIHNHHRLSIFVGVWRHGSLLSMQEDSAPNRSTS